MRTFGLVAAAMIGAVTAVKTTDTTMEVQKAGEITARDGYMGQTMSNKSYEIENLDDIQATIAKFYDDEAKPFIKKHRNMVWKAAMAKMEKENG